MRKFYADRSGSEGTEPSHARDQNSAPGKSWKNKIESKNLSISVGSIQEDEQSRHITADASQTEVDDDEMVIQGDSPSRINKGTTLKAQRPGVASLMGRSQSID